MSEAPVSPPFLTLSEQQKAREAAGAALAEQAEREVARETRRVGWQCVALTFLGVPLYLWSWHLDDSRSSHVVASAAFLVSYAAPFFRWVIWHFTRHA